MFLVFIVAYILQEESVTLPCRKNSVFQFHAVWHVMTAFGFFLLYLYFRSDHTSLGTNPEDLQANVVDDAKQAQEPVESV